MFHVFSAVDSAQKSISRSMNSICVPCMVRCRCLGNNLFARGSGGTSVAFSAFCVILNESQPVPGAAPYRISSEARAVPRVAPSCVSGRTIPPCEFGTRNLGRSGARMHTSHGTHDLSWVQSYSFSLSWHIILIGIFLKVLLPALLLSLTTRNWRGKTDESSGFFAREPIAG